MNTEADYPKLIRWYCQNGALVQQDEPLCELESSRATVDLPAPHAGVLRQLAKVGDVIRTDSDLARIEPIC